MKVTILGNNSALPAFGRHPTSQAVTLYGEVILIDCGEGTQNQMQRFGIRWRSVHHIFISHLHGDHYFGLPGLITSMSLLGRTSPLFIYGPASLQGIIDSILGVSETELSYPLQFCPLPAAADVLVDNAYFKLTSFPVEHRIQCFGLLIEKKTRGRRILPDRCKENNIPPEAFESLKAGNDYVSETGEVIANGLVTEEGPQPKKYAYCADTRYTESYLEVIKGADAIYHESTYLKSDEKKAVDRFHSTAEHAAKIALRSEAKMLYLGHYSSKYKDLEPFEEEARQIFPNSHLTVEGIGYDI